MNALSSEVCREGISMAALVSIEGLVLVLLIGREKLKAGRGRFEPLVEYSEDTEGERGIDVPGV